MSEKQTSLLEEIFLWVFVVLGSLFGLLISAMAAGFLFGLFVKFAQLAFFLVRI